MRKTKAIPHQGDASVSSRNDVTFLVKRKSSLVFATRFGCSARATAHDTRESLLKHLCDELTLQTRRFCRGSETRFCRFSNLAGRRGWFCTIQTSNESSFPVSFLTSPSPRSTMGRVCMQRKVRTTRLSISTPGCLSAVRGSHAGHSGFRASAGPYPWVLCHLVWGVTPA